MAMNLPRAALACAAALALFATTASHAATATGERAAWLGLRARDGVDAARPLARAWQNDAELVWVEAADSLFADGTAAAWSYAYFSPHARASRLVTVRASGASSRDLAFALDAPALEDGWIDLTQALAAGAKEARFSKAKGSGALRAAFACNGPIAARTTWTLGFGNAGTGEREWIADALRGLGMAERATPPADAGGPADEALPPWLSAHTASVLARSSALREAQVDRARARWLTPREASALTRLGAQDAALDTLGRGALTAADAQADASQQALARWRAATAADDSMLARARVRIDAARADLAADRPTELAVYLTLEGRARPQRVTVSIDGAPAARASYGDAEWKALDSGAWAEVARRTARSGPREVRVELEGADRRVQNASWRGTIEPGRLSVFRLRVPSGGTPALEFVAATAP